MTRDQSHSDRQSFFVLTDTPAPAPHDVLRRRFREAQHATPGTTRTLRMAALGLLGASIGVGGAVLGVSFVQASDRVDMYEMARNDDNARRARRAAAVPVYQIAPSSYAPSRQAANQPLATLNQRGLITFPDFRLNPFNPTGQDVKAPARQGTGGAKVAQKPVSEDTFDVVSGAATMPRSICVRLCDGYQHPLALIRDSGDIVGHVALCAATFPGVPTRVFRVAAGAETIDDAVGPDGKTYRSLPMAYAYQTSIDPACARPRNGAQTVSLLKDFTLRAGDAVVVNGRPKVFSGSTSYPFTAGNFRDFRSSGVVSASARKQMDDIIGVSRQERLQREVRQLQRVREASAVDPNRAVDVVRGGPSVSADRSASSQVRIIELPRR